METATTTAQTTPENLSVVNDALGFTVLTCPGTTAPEATATARLIVAAVNACLEAGYTVEELEAGRVKADRDELGRTKKDLEWTRGERDRLFALAHERGKKLDQEVE